MYGMDLPPQFAKPDLSGLDANDAIPSNINSSAISYIGEFLSAPPAFSVSNPSAPVETYGGGCINYNSASPDTTGNQGWTIVEAVSIRLRTDFTPSGRFPVYSNKLFPSTEIRVGFDAVVCLQKYEPWIIEAYNTSTGSVFTLQIVGKGDGSTSLSPSGGIRGPLIENTRYLNTMGKDHAFTTAYSNSLRLMYDTSTICGLDPLGDNYIPTSTVGPALPPSTAFLLTPNYSADCFFHRRHWTSRVHRTLSGSICHYPRAGRCN